MGRRNRRNADQERPLGSPGGFGLQSRETDSAGEWVVRRVPGAAAAKPYRCPGCDQVIVPGTPHVVAWLDEPGRGSDARRHWHSMCWQRRRR